MKYIYTSEELVQRSPEWIKLRNTKLGASDVPAILGLNKYEKAITVWKRKLGKLKPKTMTAAMQHGVNLEDEAIEKVLKHIELEGVLNPSVKPFVCIHPKHDFIAVSFDGVDVQNNYIVEVKCPKVSWNFVKVFSEGIPEIYYPQVQLQLFMANEHWGITKAFFGSYFPEGAYITDFQEFKEFKKTLAVKEATYDENYCKAMLKVVDKFMYNVKFETWDNDEYNEILETFYKSI